MRNLFILLSMVSLMAFAPVETTTLSETAVAAPCASPQAPDGILATTNAPYRACAAYLGGYPAGIDGYEWTIQGGSIISGQGSNCVDYLTSGSSVSLCVRAYSIGAGGALCYSSKICRTISTSSCTLCP